MQRHRRSVVLTVLTLGLLLGLVSWLAVEAFSAKQNLQQARSEAMQAKDALSKGHADAAVQHANAVQAHARKASDATESIPWALAAKLPWLGSPFETGQQMSARFAPFVMLAGGIDMSLLATPALPVTDPRTVALCETLKFYNSVGTILNNTDPNGMYAHPFKWWTTTAGRPNNCAVNGFPNTCFTDFMNVLAGWTAAEQ